MSNYICKYISEKYKKDWEQLVANNIAGGFHQSFAWAKFKQFDGWDTYKIGLWNNNELIGGAVLLNFTFNNGINFFYIPEGPILPYGDNNSIAWEILQSEINTLINQDSEILTTHIRIEPRLELASKKMLNHFNKAPINLQPKHTQIINLEKDLEVIKSEMKRKCRYNIKIAKKYNVQITTEELSIENLKRFYSLYKETFERAGFEGKDFELFENLASTCGEMIKLYFAKKNNQDLAAAIIINFGNRSTYLYGGSSSTGREYMPTYLLHFEIMQDAKKNKLKEYDMWGIMPPNGDKNHDWAGITNFKKKFGGSSKSFIGAYDKIIDQEKYHQFLKKHEL